MSLWSAGLFDGAIPDTTIEHWPCDDGSGSTLNNSITGNDISLDFDRWTSNTEFEGDTAPDFVPSNGDSGDATSNSAVQAFSYRVRLDDASPRRHQFSHSDDPRGYWTGTNNNSKWFFDSGNALPGVSDSNPTNIRIIICGSDGSTTYIYVYDKDGNLIGSDSSSGGLTAVSDSDSFYFGYLPSADNHDGELDQFYFHDEWLDSQQRSDLLNAAYL
jgi:hypothetical protein